MRLHVCVDSMGGTKWKKRDRTQVQKNKKIVSERLEFPSIVHNLSRSFPINLCIISFKDIPFSIYNYTVCVHRVKEGIRPVLCLFVRTVVLVNHEKTPSAH